MKSTEVSDSTPEKLIDSSSLREILQISDSTLKKLRCDADFPVYRVGWEFRYDLGEVKEYLRNVAKIKHDTRNTSIVPQTVSAPYKSRVIKTADAIKK